MLDEGMIIKMPNNIRAMMMLEDYWWYDDYKFSNLNPVSSYAIWCVSYSRSFNNTSIHLFVRSHGHVQLFITDNANNKFRY